MIRCRFAPCDQCPDTLMQIVDEYLGQDLGERHASRQMHVAGDHQGDKKGVEAAGRPPYGGTNIRFSRTFP